MEDFRIAPTDVDERLPPGLPALEAPAYLSRLKSEAADAHLDGEAVTLSADSLVVSEGRALGKPIDLAEAHAMLAYLCGREHTVVTGFTLARKGASGGVERKTEQVATQVTLAPASEAEIAHYVRNFPPLDRAGSYGIQDWIGTSKASRIEGSYTNVVGLPTAEVYASLLAWDVLEV